MNLLPLPSSPTLILKDKGQEPPAQIFQEEKKKKQ